MTKEKALDDFHHKIEHFMEQYEAINPREESKYSYIKVLNGGEFNVIITVQGKLNFYQFSPLFSICALNLKYTWLNIIKQSWMQIK